MEMVDSLKKDFVYVHAWITAAMQNLRITAKQDPA